MRIIPITPAVKRRVSTIMKNIFPKVGYVRVASSGLVILKKHWYSLRRERIPLTDLMLHSIPNRIAEIAEKNGFGVGYKVIFNSALNAMFQLISTNSHWDILDYVWDQYNRYCVVPVPPSRLPLTERQTESSKIVSFVSIGSIYGFDRLIKQINKQRKGYESDIIKTMKRRFNNLPSIRLSFPQYILSRQYSC